jgi:hypothetical protein
MQNAPEAERVSLITARGLFSERTEQGQDGSAVIVLSPLPPSRGHAPGSPGFMAR